MLNIVRRIKTIFLTQVSENVRDEEKTETTIIIESNLNGIINLGEFNRFKGVDVLGELETGRFTSLWGPNIFIRTNNEKVKIGSFCSIAKNVNIQTFNHNYKKVTTYFIGQNLFKEKWEDERISKGDIVIENDVWIGVNCTILGGITIGNGVVVAANSVVNTSIPNYAIIAGAPAKIIGYRFEKKIIDILLVVKWWEWSEEKIKMNKDFFSGELTLESFNNILN